MLDLVADLNPPYQASVVAAVERAQFSPLRPFSGGAPSGETALSDLFVLKVPHVGNPPAPGPQPILFPTRVEEASNKQPRRDDGKRRDDSDLSRGDLSPALPVLPSKSKAWLVTYLDSSRDLLVTNGEAADDCQRFLAETEIRQIWSVQRVLGGMLRVTPETPFATEATDGRWMLKNGDSSPIEPALAGKSPDENSCGKLLVKPSYPMEPLGAWQIQWPNGEMWIYVCSIGMTGADLTTALKRQFAGDFDFAVKRIDRGRLPLDELPVPGGWMLFVERYG
jgi:hypothetical protein